VQHSPAELLRSARKSAGLNQRELARRAKTAQSVVARIELGLTSPSWDTLSRLLRAAGFGVEAGLQPTTGGGMPGAVVAKLAAVAAPAVADAGVAEEPALADVERLLALSAEDRLRELRNVDRFLSAVKPA